jgi:hypothetical protein
VLLFQQAGNWYQALIYRIYAKAEKLQGNKPQQRVSIIWRKDHQRRKFIPLQAYAGLPHRIFYNPVIGQLKPTVASTFYPYLVKRTFRKGTASSSGINQSFYLNEFSSSQVSNLERNSKSAHSNAPYAAQL